MYAFIMMVAVLQSNGEYATFSETFSDPEACIAKIEVVKHMDLSATDAKAHVVYAECVRVEAK